MVTKMRLIDLNELLKFPMRRDTYDRENGDKHFINGVESVLEYAENLPTVNIVRCKDCIHSYYENGNGYDAGYFCLLQRYDEYEYEKVRPLGFCDMGERK
jgi:hypothetical protein